MASPSRGVEVDGAEEEDDDEGSGWETASDDEEAAELAAAAAAGGEGEVGRLWVRAATGSMEGSVRRARRGRRGGWGRGPVVVVGCGPRAATDSVEGLGRRGWLRLRLQAGKARLAEGWGHGRGEARQTVELGLHGWAGAGWGSEVRAMVFTAD